jgi:carbon storage regulator
MLVLSWKVGEKVVIGNCVTVTVVKAIGNKVRLGISAPEDISILRSELGACPRSPSPLYSGERGWGVG